MWISFPFSPDIVKRVESTESLGETVGETPVKTRVKTPEKILAVLAEHPDYSLADVAASIGKSLSAFERAVAKLTADGKLQRVGPAKGAVIGR